MHCAYGILLSSRLSQPDSDVWIPGIGDHWLLFCRFVITKCARSGVLTFDNNMHILRWAGVSPCMFIEFRTGRVGIRHHKLAQLSLVVTWEAAHQLSYK
eukprot:114680-Chlamydomonas_euryale.AAC.3